MSLEKKEFVVICNNSLGADEIKTLVLLYQPLMGANSFSLYMFLYSLASTNGSTYSYDQSFIADALNFKPKNVATYLGQLEALGLLKTYQKNNSTIYMLRSPLSANAYLKDTIFGRYLISEIGEKNYRLLAERFLVKTPQLTDYEEVTKQFDEVYKFEPVKFVDDSDYVARNASDGVQIKSQIDFAKFISSLPKQYQKQANLSYKVNDVVQKVALVYGYTPDEIKEIFINSTNDNNIINLATFDNKANTYFVLNRQKNVVVVKNDLSADEKKAFSTIKDLEETHPSAIINTYCANNLTGQALKTISDFLSRNVIETAYLNLILLHVLKVKEGILPSLKYLEKVYQSWLDRGVKTTLDAYEFYQKTQISPANEQTSSKKKAKNEQTPEWFDDYLKELEDMDK